jgi:hypothetical protein
MEIDLSGMWFIEPYLVAFGPGIFAYLLSGPRGFARPPPIRHTAREYWMAGRLTSHQLHRIIPPPPLWTYLVACMPLGSYRVSYFRPVWLPGLARVVARTSFSKHP